MPAAAQSAADDALSRARGQTPGYVRPPEPGSQVNERLRQQQRERLRKPLDVPDAPPRRAAPDLELQERARSKATPLRDSAAPAIQVRVEQGVAYLKGEVASEQARHRLQQEVLATPGVKRVDVSGVRVRDPD